MGKMYYYTDKKGKIVRKVWRSKGINNGLWYDFNTKQWHHQFDDIDQTFLLYKFDNVMQAKKTEKTIYIVKDEETADILNDFDYTATCFSGGCIGDEEREKAMQIFKDMNLFFIDESKSYLEFSYENIEKAEKSLKDYLKVANSVKIAFTDKVLTGTIAQAYDDWMGFDGGIKKTYDILQKIIYSGEYVSEFFKMDYFREMVKKREEFKNKYLKNKEEN